MRKTLALFGIAFTLFAVALIFGLPRGTTPDPIPADPVPTDPVPVAQASSHAKIGDLVELEATLSNTHLLAGQDTRVSLLMDLRAKPIESTGREPVSVAVVIDRSGSMAGEKIRQVRRAAKALVGKLSDHDRIALVSYASDYSLDVPLTTVGGQRKRINRVIDDILDGGGTNLAGGMQAGLDALDRARDARVRRLILLSDGNANQGITDPTSISEIAAAARHKGVSISTLGVGLDFNEDLMTLVAQSGAGGYYYAKDASAIAKAFETELSGLVALAARSVEVGLELPAGVVVSEVFGYRTEMRGGRLVIPVGHMASDERRRIMVQLDVSSKPAGTIDVAQLVLGYQATSNEIEREHRAKLSAIGTTDANAIGTVNSKVAEAFYAASAAQAREDAATKFIAGDRAAALARVKAEAKRLKKRNKTLKSARLQQQLNEINTALDGFENTDYASDAAKDLVKSEKLRARQVFVY